MASSKGYLDFVLDTLSPLEGISHRAMMGEYVIYYKGKVVGGIYDDRLLIKPTKSAVAMTPDPAFELPYVGAKEMLAADVDDRERLHALFDAVYSDLAGE